MSPEVSNVAASRLRKCRSAMQSVSPNACYRSCLSKPIRERPPRRSVPRETGCWSTGPRFFQFLRPSRPAPRIRPGDAMRGQNVCQIEKEPCAQGLPHVAAYSTAWPNFQRRSDREQIPKCGAASRSDLLIYPAEAPLGLCPRPGDFRRHGSDAPRAYRAPGGTGRQRPFLPTHWTSEPCLRKSRGEAASFGSVLCKVRVAPRLAVVGDWPPVSPFAGAKVALLSRSERRHWRSGGPSSMQGSVGSLGGAGRSRLEAAETRPKAKTSQAANTKWNCVMRARNSASRQPRSATVDATRSSAYPENGGAPGFSPTGGTDDADISRCPFRCPHAEYDGPNTSGQRHLGGCPPRGLAIA